MRAGIVPVTASGDRWTLEAKAPRTREVAAPRDALAAMLGLTAADLGTTPLWVDTGSEQLVIPLTSTEAVVRCAPDPALLLRHASLDLPGPPGSARSVRAMAYVWSRAGEGSVWRAFSFPSTARWSRIRAPVPPARIWAGGWWRPAPRGRSR